MTTQTTTTNNNSIITPDELEQLQDSHTQLVEAQELLKQTTDPGDREELAVVLEEAETELSNLVHQIAFRIRGVPEAAWQHPLQS